MFNVLVAVKIALLATSAFIHTVSKTLQAVLLALFGLQIKLGIRGFDQHESRPKCLLVSFAKGLSFYFLCWLIPAEHMNAIL